MTPGENIKAMRKSLKMTLVQLSEITGLSKSTISDIENNKSNPSSATLKKIADAFDIPLSMILDEDVSDTIAYKRRFPTHFGIKEERSEYITNFQTAQEAMQFILEQPIIMGFGGFDINNLSDEDKIEFANDLLNQLKTLGKLYNKR